jgi:hypothetical protein
MHRIERIQDEGSLALREDDGFERRARMWREIHAGYMGQIRNDR